MEQKTVEQIIAIKAWEQLRIEMGNGSIDMDDDDAFRTGYIKGFNHAQQSQPMWREIEADGEYDCVIAKSDENRIKLFDYYADGEYLLRLRYTHYLSSEDLLKLPVEKK
jgi:hypothetical protein